VAEALFRGGALRGIKGEHRQQPIRERLTKRNSQSETPHKKKQPIRERLTKKKQLIKNAKKRNEED
jgi:hypothetical protein